MYVFFVIIFGFYNLVLGRMTDLYTKIWDLWNGEIVYSDNELNSKEKKLKCSEIEMIAREIGQTYANLAYSISILHITFLTIAMVTKTNLDLDGVNLLEIYYTTNLSVNEKKEIFVLLGSLFLSFMLLFTTVPLTLKAIGINIFKKTDETDKIDETLLFEMWWKYKCHRIKNVKYQKNTQPLLLYLLLKEKIESGEIIDALDEEKELVANLSYRSPKEKIEEKIVRELIIKRDLNRNP